MSLVDFLPWITAMSGLAVATSAGTAVLAFVRGGRLPAAQAFARMLNECEPFRKLRHDVANHGSRLQSAEQLLGNVATKADLERVTGELHTLGELVKRTEKTVDRLHDWLMERGG